MNSVKSIISILAFLLIAAGFFFLIGFEIRHGIAGGKFGGVELNNMPGTFWFFISLQVFAGLYLFTRAVKELWDLFHRNIEKSDHNRPTKIIAIYWLFATLLFLIVNLLAIWTMFEMLIAMYRSLLNYEMEKRLIFGGLFLMSFGVFCYLYYMFLLRSLIDIFLPKARNSFQSLKKNTNPRI